MAGLELSQVGKTYGGGVKAVEGADFNIADGEFMVGSTKLGGRTILRPAFSNWRTTLEDVDAFADCVIATGRRLVEGG